MQANEPTAQEAAALAAARARLIELQRTCKEAHPLVQAEKRRIEELERRQRLAASPEAELVLARERLAQLRRTCKDKHPVVQAQLQWVAELEKKVRQASPPL